MMYTVGEMAKLLGVSASTLRYYDKEGLLPFVERSPGGMRMFQEKDYEWLQVIGCLKKTGMPLEEIPEQYRAARITLRQLPHRRIDKRAGASARIWPKLRFLLCSA